MTKHTIDFAGQRLTFDWPDGASAEDNIEACVQVALRRGIKAGVLVLWLMTSTQWPTTGRLDVDDTTAVSIVWGSGARDWRWAVARCSLIKECLARGATDNDPELIASLVRFGDLVSDEVARQLETKRPRA